MSWHNEQAYGRIYGIAFLAWVKQFVAPVLRPSDIVVMDNLGSHEGVDVRHAIETAGAQIRYLPPYGHDFNPTKQVFSKLKTRLRKTVARTGGREPLVEC